MKTHQRFAMIAAAALLSLCPALRADGVEITLSTVSAAPGGSVEVVGNVTNDTSSLVFLNGDSFSLADTSLTLDDSDFFNNAPFTLGAGATSGPFDIFIINIASSAAPGLLTPNFFSILGGADANAGDVIGTVMFDVNVQGVTPAPEPSALILLACGIAAITIRRRFSPAHTPSL
jgi:hypothetical protein